MLRIKESGSTFLPSLLALQACGFSVSCRPRKGKGHWWVAESADLELVAKDPLQLLGLAKLAEVRGTEWRETGEEGRATLMKYKLQAIRARGDGDNDQ
jgi:hypothetical protein